MSDPQRSGGGGIGDRINDAIGWLQNRSRNEWIMFGIGVVIGVVIG